MKIYSIFFASILIFYITACDRKPEEPKAAVTPNVAAQKSAETLPPTANVEPSKKALEKEVVKEVQKSADVHATQGVKKSADTKAPANATEQALGDTIDHARDVTKSEVSGSREHSQKTEDEMSDSLKGK
jgi:hypothetical protein